MQIFHAKLSVVASSNQKLLEVDQKRIILPAADRAQLISLYDSEIRYLDAAFGKFITQLKQLHMYDNSIIVFLSDHGEAFQEHGRLGHGSQLYQPMIHVPLIIKVPAQYKIANLRVRENVQTMDVMPTILELARISVPETVQGKSLLPFMNRTKYQNRTTFSESLSWGLICMTKDRYKYIHSDSGKEELFDLKTDPEEMHNLSMDRPDLVKTFREERNRFLKSNAQWQKYGIPRSEKIQLDEHQNEQLKALGYVQKERGLPARSVFLFRR